MRVDQPTGNFSLYASPTPHALFSSSSAMNNVSPPLTITASFVSSRESYSPSLLFGSLGPKSKRSASAMESDRQLGIMYNLHPHKRTTLPHVSNSELLSFPSPPSAIVPIHTAIPDEPSLLHSTPFEEVDSSPSASISLPPVEIPSRPTLSTPSTIIIPAKSIDKSTYKSKPPSRRPTDPATPSFSSSSPSSISSSPSPSSSKRRTTPGSSSTRPLQFINKSGPPPPRPKPQQPPGIYIQTHSAMQQKARKKIREEGKVKRSSNCFILYRTHIHPVIVARYGHQNNKEISRLAGRYWKNAPESVKSFYRQQAAEEKVRHAALYPSYKYTPAKTASKDDTNANSAKSKVRRPWNKPIRLSPPLIKPSSPLSVPSSPSPSLYESEGTKGDSEKPVENESSEHPSLHQAVERNKTAVSAAHSTATSKPPNERGFVVTETPLFDFTGNADLSEKKRNSKSRAGPRPNRPNPRLPDLEDPLSFEMAHASSTASVSSASPFTFVLQGPAVPKAPLTAGPKGVSGLTQALAHQRSDSQAIATPTVPVFPQTPVSETPPGWSNMVSQLQVSGAAQEQQWPVPQSSPLLGLTQPQNAVFQGNIGVSPSDILTDQQWAQQHSPQPAPPFSRIATNLVQSPQPSAPIQIPAPSASTASHFCGSFDSPMYTPVDPTGASIGTGDFPWQLDANLRGSPDFGLLYTSGSLSSTSMTLSSASSHSHLTIGHLPLPTVSSFEDDFESVGLEQKLLSSHVSDDIFDEATWSSSLQMPSPSVSDLDQQLLLSTSSSNSALSSSFGSIYSDMAISAWTTIGEPRVPSPDCLSNVSSPSFNNVNLSYDNDSNNCMNINDSNAEVDDGQALMVPTQPAPMPPVPLADQTLPWGDEEQLKMSISYFEDIVQQQKALLSLRQQWRQQARVVQPSVSALAPTIE
ncbi:hypothetical protein BGZ88_003591 [Linnemannia elongata]|nr:hypothetical protein BGZ88_003591 [Linnemannia elongata]